MHRIIRSSILFLLLFLAHSAIAQPEKKWIKHQISTLSSPSMQGRGYVNKGVDKAASYLSRMYSQLGLHSFSDDSSYFQTFYFPVNTFPNRVDLKLQRKELTPGVDFLVHEASAPFHSEKLKVKKIDLSKIKDSTSWARTLNSLKPHRAYILSNLDTPAKHLSLNRRQLGKELPQGVFLIPTHGKLTWSVATDTISSTIFYVEDTIMPRRICRASVQVDTKFIPAFESKNVIGYIPGTEQPDSFIVFTAHFDHLGRMGRRALFPGAHDNASGTSLMLYLASWFAAHPPRYSVAFMAFSGEEAGLIGSRYYTEHPLFPLSQIKFVVNMDMTGSAKDGITVVNAVEQKEAFNLLREINSAKGYLPAINERSQARNSDHYYFSEKGVPAIFIYALGSKGFYHDVFDKHQELTLEKIDDLAKLLIDFTSALTANK